MLQPLSFMMVLLIAVADDEKKPDPIRYLKPAGKRYVLESEVTITPTADGSTYVSRTERGRQTMTLTIHRDKHGRVLRAEIVQQSGDKRNTASLELQGTSATLTRGGSTEKIEIPADPVVTTAPDWSDIFQLVKRYDAKKGGKQEFAGLWFHPSRPHRKLTFTVERLGKDAVKVKDREETLLRYRVILRSGPYLVWAKSDGTVCKILPPGKKAVPVVLEGYEEAARGLK